MKQIAALTLKLRDHDDLDGVVGQILNIPAVCHPKQFPHDKYELNSYKQNADSPTINAENMAWFWGTIFQYQEPSFTPFD